MCVIIFATDAPSSVLNLTSNMSNAVLKESDDFEIACAFAGNPVADIQWFGPRNSSPIQNNSRSRLTALLNYTDDNPKYGGIVELRLMIQNLSLDDAGEYQCVGVNTLGRLTEIYKLTIEQLTTSMADIRSTTTKSHNGNGLILIYSIVIYKTIR